MSSPTNPYAEAHASPKGEGDARPTAMQIIEDEGLISKLSGKVFLVTGSSSGIGIETARALHATGADVYMQVRNVPKGQKVLDDIKSTSKGTGKLELLEMNFETLQSVRDGVKAFLSRTSQLNVLINNAGIRNTPDSTTPDGFENQWAINHLAPFLLTHLLLPTLLASSTLSFNSRVINLSSTAHCRSPINFSNPNLTGIYEPRLAYAQSKTANIMHTNEIEVRYGAKGVHGLSVHPGCILTGLQAHDDPERLKKVREELGSILKTTAQGAATTVWGAVGNVWEGKGGVYLEDVREGHVGEEVDVWNGGVKPFCFEREGMGRLWGLSCEMVGVEEEKGM